SWLTSIGWEPSLAITAVLATNTVLARWAAKEAFIKAWSAALYGSQPVLPEGHWDAIEITNDRWGRPAIILGAPIAGAVHKTLGSVNIHVSMSHDGNVASAVVLIEYQNNSEVRRAARAH
ncbi:4'-phosphopantetheinyl transferase superfamily protein, partial [Actinotignum timonense]|nr:4'-phosphopantetheinyl transferase superfamily protein [Actinotignum timonense]